MTDEAAKDGVGSSSSKKKKNSKSHNPVYSVSPDRSDFLLPLVYFLQLTFSLDDNSFQSGVCWKISRDAPEHEYQ